MTRPIYFVLCGALLAGCSTQVQEAESDLYAPIYPAEDVALTRQMPTGGIYSASAKGLFAADRRAAKVGDILTVDFSERFAASKSQAAGSSKSDSFAVTVPKVFSSGLNDSLLSGGTSQSFAGKGSASQSNSLTGRVSVSVVRVLPGGNLEIVGQKKLTLNNGQEYIRLRGIVRPSDISSDNVVLSDRIANAEIKYIGAGDVADSARQGWFHKAMNVVSPF